MFCTEFLIIIIIYNIYYYYNIIIIIHLFLSSVSFLYWDLKSVNVETVTEMQNHGPFFKSETKMRILDNN